MKDQTSQGFPRNVLSIDFWKISHLENLDASPNFSRVSSWMYWLSYLRKIPHLENYRWKTKLLKSFIENVLSVDLWKIPNLGNINESPNFSRFSPRNVLSVDLWKNPTLQKISTESQNFSRVSSKIVLSVDLWKIPTLGKYRWKSKLLNGSIEKLYWMWTSEISTLGKYWWKIKLPKSCIENVLSMNFWKIPHSENTNESPNSSRVSSKMY